MGMSLQLAHLESQQAEARELRARNFELSDRLLTESRRADRAEFEKTALEREVQSLRGQLADAERLSRRRRRYQLSSDDELPNPHHPSHRYVRRQRVASPTSWDIRDGQSESSGSHVHHQRAASPTSWDIRVDRQSESSGSLAANYSSGAHTSSAASSSASLPLAN